MSDGMCDCERRWGTKASQQGRSIAQVMAGQINARDREITALRARLAASEGQVAALREGLTAIEGGNVGEAMYFKRHDLEQPKRPPPSPPFWRWPQEVAVHALARVALTTPPAPKPIPDRDTLGRLVREIWIAWANEQPAPKPSWLTPYDDLSEPDREVDRRIGERLYRAGASAVLAAPTPDAPNPLVALWGIGRDLPEDALADGRRAAMEKNEEIRDLRTENEQMLSLLRQIRGNAEIDRAFPPCDTIYRVTDAVIRAIERERAQKALPAATEE